MLLWALPFQALDSALALLHHAEVPWHELLDGLQ